MSEWRHTVSVHNTSKYNGFMEARAKNIEEIATQNVNKAKEECLAAMMAELLQTGEADRSARYQG